MRRMLVVLLAALAALGAEDAWKKVRELKSGTELRIYKTGAKQPVLARFDELTEDNLVVVVKNEQVAIARDQVERVDYRPVKSRVTTETKATVNDAKDLAAPATGPGGGRTPRSVSSGVWLGSKPDFETIYRRPPPAPKAK